jgi:hypothetical protein
LGTKEHREASRMTTAEARTRLHDLIESLPSDDVPTALRVLEALNTASDSPPLALRDIPFDDEPETEEERAAIAEAYRDLEEGRVISNEEMTGKYGCASPR